MSRYICVYTYILDGTINIYAVTYKYMCVNKYVYIFTYAMPLINKYMPIFLHFISYIHPISAKKMVAQNINCQIQ